MANEITSQITSTVTTRSRSVEPISRPGQAETTQVDAASNVDKRQALAAGRNEQPESQVVQLTDREQATDETRLQQAVSDINSYVQTVNRELQFRVDEALPLGRTVISVIDAETEETIREIPSEEVLALAHRLNEQLNESERDKIEGLIISAQA